MAMKMVAYTQVYENYYNNHWKPKGGEEYVLCTLTYDELAVLTPKQLDEIAHTLVKPNLLNNEMVEEYMIDWALVDEKEMREAA